MITNVNFIYSEGGGRAVLKRFNHSQNNNPKQK